MMTNLARSPLGVSLSMEPSVNDWYTPAVTMEDQLLRIPALEQRVSEHVKFMRTVEKTEGISEETKQKAVEQFYKHMVVLERRLVRIRDDLRLA